ncbi:aromatic amino acid transaminase [Roseibacillus persicicus]|nr:amino acid aminotransferase [Roseibacillus persicicus]
MFTQLAPPTPDPLWGLAKAFQQDPRSEKMDLIVGVYRDASGKTPVMESVQEAERFLASAAESKSYRGLSGNLDFNDGIARFVLGSGHPALERQSTIQTVAGTGALRLIGDLIAKLSPQAKVWTTDPAYVNHLPIMAAAGLEVQTFPWRESETGLDFEAVVQALDGARAGDILLLHGCCHNPTGIDPSLEQWSAISRLCHDKGLIPFVDMAYQGFGDGVDADAAGLRLLAGEHEQMFVTLSCSKNMSLYCERTGAAMVIASEAGEAEKVRLSLEQIARANYSMPPNHGAAIAAYLFAHPEAWLKELEECRMRVCTNRQNLAAELKAIGAPEKFQCLERQKGMFSLLPLSSSQIERLRDEFAIYGAIGGRINVAGLGTQQIPLLADALKRVFDSP